MERQALLTEQEIIWRAEDRRRHRRFLAIYFLVVLSFFIVARVTPNGYWWIARHLELWEGILIGSGAELVAIIVSKWCGDRIAWLRWFSHQ